jgi:hypothetical protein
MCRQRGLKPQTEGNIKCRKLNTGIIDYGQPNRKVNDERGLYIKLRYHSNETFQI